MAVSAGCSSLRALLDLIGRICNRPSPDAARETEAKFDPSGRDCEFCQLAAVLFPFSLSPSLLVVQQIVDQALILRTELVGRGHTSY